MLHPLAPDLWDVVAHHRLAPGVSMPIRMTVVRLAGGVWLHAPVPIDGPLAEAITALGPVRWIVAPNALHHLHVGPAATRWPDAAVVAAAPLRTKRPDLRIDHTLDAPAPWDPDLEALAIEGAPGVSETVFFHRPSGTLICTDLVFNVHDAPGWATPFVLRLTGTWRHLAQSRVWRWTVKDRAAAAASAEWLLAWPIARIVPAHGDVLEHDAHARLAEALGWMRAGA